MKKLLSLLLALIMVLSLFAGCRNEQTPPTEPAGTEPPQVVVPEPPVMDREVANTDVKGFEKYLEYTLTQEDADKFYNDLDTLSDALLEGVDWASVEALEEKLDEYGYYMSAQNSIAYILMTWDESNEEYSKYYTDSTDILADAAAAYKKMAREVYQSDSKLKEQYFADWTEAEIRELLNFTDEVAELEKRNAQILVEYRALDDATMTSDMIPLYRELVLNNNRIAQITGYDNYYDYAYEMRYSRDYEPEQAQVVRDYVTEYIVPSFPGVMNKTITLLAELNDDQMYVLSGLLLQKNFDELSRNYVDKYIKSLPATAARGMQNMFLESRAIFADGKNANESAFTTMVDDGLFCYFGPGYQSSMTAVHELGHYYALDQFLELNPDMNALSLDLAEVHSQGNEWLFTSYLDLYLDKKSHDALVYYRMYENLAGIIVQMCVDSFEEKVYTHPDIENLTEEDFEAIMIEVCEDYGGIDYVEENITDIQWYWRMVVLENPGYYISYAVSSIAALDIYFNSVQDYDAAVQTYCELVEGVDEEGGFLSNLQRVGLHGPFEPDVYIAIAALAEE